MLMDIYGGSYFDEMDRASLFQILVRSALYNVVMLLPLHNANLSENMRKPRITRLELKLL